MIQNTTWMHDIILSFHCLPSEVGACERVLGFRVSARQRGKIAVLICYYLTMMKYKLGIFFPLFETVWKSVKRWWRLNFWQCIRGLGPGTVSRSARVCVCVCCTKALYQMLAECSTWGSIELWPETGRQYLDLSRLPLFLSLIFITWWEPSWSGTALDAVVHTHLCKHKCTFRHTKVCTHSQVKPITQMLT